MKMVEETKCPWCGSSVVLRVDHSRSQYGDVKESKCPNCNQIAAARLSSIPDDIIKKGTE